MENEIIIVLGLILLIFIFFPHITKNLEKFWVYGGGTRICNNRGCDVRLVQDHGTYYCRNKKIEN
jgi:hypothetical protein